MTAENPYDWNELGRHWIADNPDPLWRDFTDRQQVEWVRRWLPPPAGSTSPTRLLKTDLFDESVSTGLFPALHGQYDEVHGIDVAAELVGHCQAKYPALRARVASVAALPYEGAFFHAIYSGSTLDHLPSAEAIRSALAELARVLRHDGHAVITLDNPHNPIIALRNGPLRGLGSRRGLIPYEMGATLTARQFRKALHDAGFLVRELTAVQHVPRVVLIPLLRRLGRTPNRLSAALGRWAQWCETLAWLPTRRWTGHYLLAAVSRN